MAPRRRRRGQYEGMGIKERWTVFKHNRRKPGWVELLAYGISLNIIGCALLLIKAQMDKDAIEAAIERRFVEDGVVRNVTRAADEVIPEPNSVIMVVVTMFGRMANVVGTMKMYKALARFFSDRKRKKFRTTTERLQNGDTEAEVTELLAECCQVC